MMKPNAGRKANAKLMLNSLWGKLGQTSKPTSEYIKEPSKWYKLLKRAHNGEITLHSREHNVEPARQSNRYGILNFEEFEVP